MLDNSPTTEVLDSKQAAVILHLSPHTLRNLRCTGERAGHIPAIPYFRIGRAVRYLRSDLDAYIQKQVEASQR